jgi:hypothetical protein
MNKQMKILIYIFAALFFSLQQCKGSFFEMAIEQDAIYTPGKINLTMKLNDNAKYDGEYQFRVSVYIAGTLFRKQNIKNVRGEPVIYELGFPEVFSVTSCRCRCELFIGEDFIEAGELPFTLWPSIAPYPGESLRKKVIWTFDTSGRLQELFDDLEVKVVDATFQAARDFGSPDIVFIGQKTDPNNMRLITERLVSVESRPVIVFLKQKQFLKETKLEIPAENNRSQNVKCDMDSPLLDSLSLRDLMKMADNTAFIKIKKGKDSDKAVTSYVTENKKDEKNIYSFLFTSVEKGQHAIYCQLPVTDGNDPRYAVLLKNLLKFANNIIDSEENRTNPDIERRQL